MTVKALYLPVETHWNPIRQSGWKFCAFRGHGIYVDLQGDVTDHIHVPHNGDVTDFIDDRMASAPWKYGQAHPFNPMSNNRFNQQAA